MLNDQTLQANREQIEQFVKVIFKHATTGFISFRQFTHDKPSKPWGRVLEEGDDGNKHWVWPALPIAAMDQVIEFGWELGEIAANAESRVVFAPPVTTLANPWSAKTKDIAEGVALSVECDGPDAERPHAKSPYDSAELLLDIMGAPTLALTSGSIWTDPTAGEEQKKCHFHYRLRTPTRDAEAHEKLRQARTCSRD